MSLEESQNLEASSLETGISRRDVLKLGAASGVGGALTTLGGGLLFSGAAEAAQTSPSPWNPAWAWTQEMPIPAVCAPVASMAGPLPTRDPEADASPAFNPSTLRVEQFVNSRTEPHQRWDEPRFGNVDGVSCNADLYEIMCCEQDWSFYPPAANIAPSKIWGFKDLNNPAAYGLIRVMAHYGKPVLIRMHNALPSDNLGFGINQMSCHLHNAHNPPESDGGPLRFYGSGSYYDYWYPNIRAGFASTHASGTDCVGPDGTSRHCEGDYRETQSSLWFHDHRMDFTSQNVYKGMASFYSLFSDDINLDTGVESTDKSIRGLGLPSGQYDIPIVITDKRFDPNDGHMYMDTKDFAGHLGDMTTVNMKIKPFLNVEARRYRLRLLNAGPSRFVELTFSNAMSFARIGNDGNLLPKAQQLTSVRLGCAERADIVVDFTNIKPGTAIYLENRLEQLNAGGPTGKLRSPSTNPNLATSTQILKIIVGNKPAVPDTTTTMVQLVALPKLLDLPAIPTSPAPKKRSFSFGTSSGMWNVNGAFFDPAKFSAYPIEGTVEEWTLSGGNGWAHPIHFHHDEFQLTQRNGKAISKTTGDDYSRKDVVRIGDGAVGTANTSSVTLRMRFRDWYGDYPVHCHNVVHEDHAMMIRFKIVPPTDPNAGK